LFTSYLPEVGDGFVGLGVGNGPPSEIRQQ